LKLTSFSMATALLLAGFTAGPSLAKSNKEAAAPPKAVPGKHLGHAASDTAASWRVNPIAAARLVPDTAARTARPQLPVLIVPTQHLAWGRLSFVLRGNPAPSISRHPDGIELTFAAGTQLQLPPGAHLRETAAIEIGEQAGAPIARVRFACGCTPDEQTADGILRLDFHKLTTAAKDKPTKTGDAAEMDTLRETLTAKIATLNGTAQTKPPAVASPSAAEAPPVPVEVTQIPAQPAQDTALPAPVCLAPVAVSKWRGPGEFSSRLVALRAQLGLSEGAAADMAALAEFYLANGLGHEALAVATDALTGDAAPEDRIRLTRDADVARLVKGEQVAAEAELLAVPPGCAREDAPLWRALAAAAARDQEGAARDPEAVASILRGLPEPLMRALVFRLAAGVGDNPAALLAMAGVLRNSITETPEDESRRFLLQARIAKLAGDNADYATFLQRAARHDLTVPGVVAKARLAAVRAQAGGPDAAHAEIVLADVARTYRHEALGQQAAEQYAELQLRRHDYAAALSIADESAGPRGAQTRESRGADLAVRILRMLLVDPAATALPSPAERVALFLRYGGYTTPGDKGDDIRLAAAQLMLRQGMPFPALDVLRQMSDIGAALPDALLMRATAEARAGDPNKALALLKGLPEGIAPHRIAADALRRLNQPVQAAHALDDVASAVDRERRASLLFEGEAWKEAATAYAELLRDRGLAAEARNDVARRYALAVAMTGESTDATPKELPEEPSRLLAAIPPPTSSRVGSGPDMNALRGALERARSIETLLDPTTSRQGS
jgi:hypothetical protein